MDTLSIMALVIGSLSSFGALAVLLRNFFRDVGRRAVRTSEIDRMVKDHERRIKVLEGRRP